jgi:Cytochrome c7 and related cytochrome c
MLVDQPQDWMIAVEQAPSLEIWFNILRGASMRIFTFLKKWRWVFIGLLGIALAAGVYFLLTARAKAAPEQPLAFNHQAMIAFGMNCLYCHNSASQSPAAGMPSVQLCMGCHEYIDTNNPEIQKLAGYWERQEPIPWTRVYQLPRFVYFSHQVHIAANQDCANCHGDVSKMTVAVPAVRIGMGMCLNCHVKQENGPQLKDCIVCHR